MPIYGPFTTEEGGTGTSNDFYRYRQRYVGTAKKGSRPPMPYIIRKAKIIYRQNSTDNVRDMWLYPDAEGQLDRARTLGFNKTYDKCLDKARNSAQIGASLAEMGQSVSMVSSRLKQLATAALHVKNGRISKALEALGSPDLRSKRTKGERTKSAANQWLEIHFGWEPLIKDIHSGVQVLTAPINDTPVRAKSFDSFDITRDWGNDVTELYRVITTQKQGYSLRVKNPNLALANQLGLINPISVAWELVPYSFVVDWFVNVGAVINSVTDFIGFELVNAWNLNHEAMTRTYTWPDRILSGDNIPGSTFVCEGLRMTRGVSVVTPSLAFRRFKGFSPTRGLTAISLLVGHLKSFK